MFCKFCKNEWCLKIQTRRGVVITNGISYHEHSTYFFYPDKLHQIRSRCAAADAIALSLVSCYTLKRGSKTILKRVLHSRVCVPLL